MAKISYRTGFISALLAIFLAAGVPHSQSNATNIGYIILDIEREIPGRPDVKTALGTIIKLAVEAIKQSKVDEISDEREKAIAIFRAIASTLRFNGYHHKVGTYPESLTSVLSSPAKLFDCDTGTFIFLSVADELGLPVSMVEVEVADYDPSRAFGDHNFVRWTLKDGGTVDWDANDERLRRGDRQTSLYGYAWSKDQLLGYVLFARGLAWEKLNKFDRSLVDYDESIKSFPTWHKAKNNIAWLLSSRRELQTLGRQKEALTLAQEVVSVHPTPNNRDTLACAYALNGDFESAVRIQKKVVQDSPGAASFRENLERLERGKNCIVDG